MQTRSTLKGYFVTNAVPTQGNFSDLIDSAFIQIDDGIRKQGKEPVALQAQEDNNGEQQLLHFYKNFTDDAPAWKFSLLKQGGSNAASGLRIGNTAAAQNALFINENNGNVGIGINSPGTTLDVNGTGWFRSNAREAQATSGQGIKISTQNSVGYIYSYDYSNSKALNLVLQSPGGNVGIGTSTPGFPLTFKDALGEKISFWGQSGNSYGIGIQSSQLQLYTDTRDASIVFGYGSSSNFNETMRIMGTGNVGIGTTKPFSKLCNTDINLIGTDGNGGNPGSFAWVANQAGYAVQMFNQGTNTNANGLVLKIASNQARAFDVSQGLNSYDKGTSLFVVNGNGNVGIRINSPATALDVNGMGWFRNNNGGGLPTTAGQGIKITTEGGVGNIFSYDYGSSQALNLVLQNAGGNVGIGTLSPSAKLHVVGSGQYNLNKQYGYLNNDGASHNPAVGNIPASILTSDRIVASEFDTFSDQRIKKDCVLNNAQQSLKTINLIQIKDFHYKDNYQYGSTWYKGVIAQELETVLPEAVTTHTDFVPDVYALPQATAVSNNILTLTMENPHGLVADDVVRLITPAGNKEVKVMPISDTIFTVENWQEAATEIFVYGKQVNDYRTVNYSSIFTLGISAIQELYRQLQGLKEELTSIKMSTSPAFAPAL